jgi:hypothetical protein
MAARVLLTLIGAAGLIVGAFMQWFKGMTGTRLSFQALYTHPFRPEPRLWNTVGFYVLVLAFAAVVGLATSGWLTRLAGSLGIVIFILIIIQLYLPHAQFLPGPGPWLVLSGGMVAAVGGG